MVPAVIHHHEKFREGSKKKNAKAFSENALAFLENALAFFFGPTLHSTSVGVLGD